MNGSLAGLGIVVTLNVDDEGMYGMTVQIHCYEMSATKRVSTDQSQHAY